MTPSKGPRGTNPGEPGGVDVTAGLRITWDGMGLVTVSSDGGSEDRLIAATLSVAIKVTQERLEYLSHALRLFVEQRRP